MKWVTWQNIGVDRMASAWLIGRWIDPKAEFTFIPFGEKASPKDGEPFDIPGERLSHHGGHCTFYAILHEHRIDDPVLARVAQIVDEADEIHEILIEHAAAKSVIAAAYFNHLAGARNLNLRAIARGTNPESEFSAKTLEGLQRDGLMLPEGTPQKLTRADLERTRQIISFCELPTEYQQIGVSRSVLNVERWNDVPQVSENYEKARDKIVEHLGIMMK